MANEVHEAVARLEEAHVVHFTVDGEGKAITPCRNDDLRAVLDALDAAGPVVQAARDLRVCNVRQSPQPGYTLIVADGVRRVLDAVYAHDRATLLAQGKRERLAEERRQSRSD